ncbi:hypothetical protein MRX96_059831 [Rhipicephalus microplus]
MHVLGEAAPNPPLLDQMVAWHVASIDCTHSPMRGWSRQCATLCTFTACLTHWCGGTNSWCTTCRTARSSKSGGGPVPSGTPNPSGSAERFALPINETMRRRRATMNVSPLALPVLLPKHSSEYV